MAVIEFRGVVVSRGKRDTTIADTVDLNEYIIPTDRRFYKGMEIYVKGFIEKAGKRPHVRPISLIFYED